jgi:hypothetical protein
MGVDSFGVPPIYLILALIVLGLSVFISFNRANSYLDDAQKLAPAT